jgi:hypothetical protein
LEGEMKKLIIAVFIILVSATSVFADPLVEFEGRYWFTNFASKLRVSDGGLGTEINLKSDLGMKSENFPEGRFTWFNGKNSRIRIAYTQESFDGDKVLSRTIEFGGKTYEANTRVLSNLDIKYGRVGWIWQFINITDTVKLGTEVDVKLFDIKSKLTAPDVDISESKNFFFGLPTLGLVLDVNPPILPIDVFAEATGMYAGKYGYCYDTEAGVKFVPIKFVSIEGGYRIFYIKVENDEDFGKLQLTGPFVGATIRF